MVVLRRKQGEEIVVPECGLTVTVLGIEDKTVRLGIVAPPGATVNRKEILDRISPFLMIMKMLRLPSWRTR